MEHLIYCIKNVLRDRLNNLCSLLVNNKDYLLITGEIQSADKILSLLNEIKFLSRISRKAIKSSTLSLNEKEYLSLIIENEINLLLPKISFLCRIKKRNQWLIIDKLSKKESQRVNYFISLTSLHQNLTSKQQFPIVKEGAQ